MIIYAILLAALYAGSCTAQMGMGMGGGMGMGMGMGGGCAIDPKCYMPCPDYTLADAFPFIRQTPISCDDCMKLCNKMQSPQNGPYMCASAVYDASVGSCDIFAVRDMGGMRKKRDCNGGKCQQQQKQPHKQKYPGRIYLTPTGMCAGGGNDTGSTAAGGATTSAGGSYSAPAETTTSSSASTTTSASPGMAKKKMIKDQAPIRRKDAVGATSTRCIAATTGGGIKDCHRGAKWVGHRKVNCVPTHDECNRS